MTSARERRSLLYREAHGEPAQVFATKDGVSIEAFGFDFALDDTADPGFILLTNGMSDRAMHLDATAQAAFDEGEIVRRIELVWYVRALEKRYIAHLRWLAEFPFLDKTWLGHGHTIPMPAPIFPGSELATFFFLLPIVRRHATLFDEFEVDRDKVELYAVHLLTTPEYERKKRDGVNAMLDLFDAGPYPLVLDEERDSLVPPRKEKKRKRRRR